MFSYVKKGLVLGGVLIICICLVNFFLKQSEPSDLELSGVWGGLTCFACDLYEVDCDSPPNDCVWDDEFNMCVGDIASGDCVMDTGGVCWDTGNSNDYCNPSYDTCRRMPTTISGCVEDPMNAETCISDEAWEWYACADPNSSFNSCSGTYKSQ